jgi:hypothetical protein
MAFQVMKKERAQLNQIFYDVGINRFGINVPSYYLEIIHEINCVRISFRKIDFIQLFQVWEGTHSSCHFISEGIKILRFFNFFKNRRDRA